MEFNHMYISISFQPGKYIRSARNQIEVNITTRRPFQGLDPMQTTTLEEVRASCSAGQVCPWSWQTIYAKDGDPGVYHDGHVDGLVKIQLLFGPGVLVHGNNSSDNGCCWSGK